MKCYVEILEDGNLLKEIACDDADDARDCVSCIVVTIRDENGDHVPSDENTAKAYELPSWTRKPDRDVSLPRDTFVTAMAGDLAATAGGMMNRAWRAGYDDGCNRTIATLCRELGEQTVLEALSAPAAGRRE